MTHRTYLAVIISLFATLIVLALWLTQHQVSGFTLKNSHRVSCATSSSGAQIASSSKSEEIHAQATLSIQLIMPIKTNELLNYLCNSKTIQSQYSDVEISWIPRNALTGADILTQRFDVVMGRLHSFSGILPNFSDYYHVVHVMSGYPVFWFIREPLDLTDPTILTTQRIGLVEDAYSHTHYLIPLNYLSTTIGAPERVDIRYYTDTYALYQAFIANEVDVISSVLPFIDVYQGPLYKNLIAEADVGGLYVNRTISKAVQCELADALTIVTDHLSQLLQLEKSTRMLEQACE